MSNETVGSRQAREAEFYNQLWSQRAESEFPSEAVAFQQLETKETRPYNMGWEYVAAIKALNIGGKDVLEMGCGLGSHTALLAKLGARVSAFDISSSAVEIAKARLARYNLSANLTVMSAEKLNFLAESFDYVFGYGILHHVTLKYAAPEIHRVLRPNGVAVFSEWIDWPIFDRIRNLSIVVKSLPHGGFKNGADRNITEDERKLNEDDKEILRSCFAYVHYRPFYCFNRLTEFTGGKFEAALQKLDYSLFQWFPFTQKAAAGAIITLRK